MDRLDTEKYCKSAMETSIFHIYTSRTWRMRSCDTEENHNSHIKW